MYQHSLISLLHPLHSPFLYHFCSECMGSAFSTCLHVGVCPLQSIFHLSLSRPPPLSFSRTSAIHPASLYPPSVYLVPCIHTCCHAGTWTCRHGSMGGCLLNSIASGCELSKEEQCYNAEGWTQHERLFSWNWNWPLVQSWYISLGCSLFVCHCWRNITVSILKVAG